MSATALKQRLEAAFPERELIMRSQGQVRFIRISSRVQKMAAGACAALALGWCGSMGLVAIQQLSATSDHALLRLREAKVAKSESRLEQYRDNLDGTVSDLARRQKFIETVVESHIGDLPADARSDETVTDSAAEAADTVKKVSAVVPEAAGLAKVEAEQLAFVERLTRYADRRADATAQTIRKLGLNPQSIAASNRGGEGGPFEALSTNSDGTIDSRFARLGESLARMDALENGLASIPQVSPAHVAYVSSSFGYRSDPFTHSAAFHAGLDFPGPMGSPIYAAAKGRVTFVGQRQGYGNCIEISHGNGLMTRYGHLSRFNVRPGQMVDGGTRIAAMGSTGRSTGPHLHFEVRVNGQPKNPRSFLEAARNVQQEAR